MRYGVRWTEFFVILDHLLPFYPPNNMKNQHFEKMEKLLEDIIILHMWTISDDHIPEIWSTTDRIISHFGPFATLFLRYDA